MVNSYDVFTAIGVAVSMVTTLYAAYWAFVIRRALAVRLYRNQALGIGILAIAVALTQVNATISNYSANYPGFLTIIFPYFTTLTLFYWIDTSVQAGRRSDPLLRDTLHWKGLRVFLLSYHFYRAIVRSGRVPVKYFIRYLPDIFYPNRCASGSGGNSITGRWFKVKRCPAPSPTLVVRVFRALHTGHNHHIGKPDSAVFDFQYNFLANFVGPRCRGLYRRLLPLP